MSQEVLVDRVGDGYSTSNLSRFERDEQDIARDKLERLADALDTPLSLIYAEAELLKASETRPTLARAMVDLNQIQDIKVKAEVISLVSAIRNETIPKDRFEAALTLLLNR